MAAVDVTEERRIDVVPQQLLEPLRQLANCCPRYREAVVLLRAQPRDHVFQDDAESRSLGAVGAAYGAGLDKVTSVGGTLHVFALE